MRLPIAPAPSPIHPCAHCATLQKTCCQVDDVFVTEGDRARIEAHVGHAEFWERRVRVRRWEHDERDPNWAQMTTRADGTCTLLKRGPDGDCTFLRPSGCALPQATRPLICRLFPITFTERGIDGEDDFCPRALVAPAEETMVAALDIRRETAEQWCSQLYAELHAGSP